jgi:DDE superfamily endonuclease
MSTGVEARHSTIANAGERLQLLNMRSSLVASGKVRLLSLFTICSMLSMTIWTSSATLIYLPKYSPDLNPIELAFSKLKAHLRKAAEHTISRLWRRIGRAVTDFTAQECSNYFRHA